MKRINDNEPVECKTFRNYPGHPAGSKCIAHREDFGRRLILTFEDGERVELGPEFCLAGIERELTLVEEEDLRFFAAIDAMVAALQEGA